jgi:pyruvate dehydrogenase E2 component (dihydrolipoamide acetyltransferase)
MATPNPVEPGRGEPQVEKLSLMRRAMVRRMDEAAVIPCFYLRVTADVTDVAAERRRVRDAGDRPPSVNDYLVRAAALALRAHPEVNASYDAGTIHQHPRVNVGVAIAVPGGLVVPAVYDADRRLPSEISATVRELADLATRRKLGRDVLTDATFSISNLGMFGVEDFDAVLNPPQAAILSVGAVHEHEGRSAVRVALGCDHRVLTGAEGAEFLRTLVARLGDLPALTALGPVGATA